MFERDSERDMYVDNGAWLRPTGRPDHIDEIADQFERPARDEDSPVA